MRAIAEGDMAEAESPNGPHNPDNRPPAAFTGQQHPGRSAARDVAAALLFFATAPHFITGQLLTVDGGLGL